MHFVRLLDDQSFDIISTYGLDAYEYACSVLSCSFAEDSNVYYCIGTAYVLPEENEPTKVISFDVISIFIVLLQFTTGKKAHLVHYENIIWVLRFHFFSLTGASLLYQWDCDGCIKKMLLEM